MKDRPAGVTDADVRSALAAWGIDAPVDFAPVGYGDYHWTAGGRWFVTVARSAVEQAMDTASALRGLEFVVAPVPALSGATVVPLGEYSVSVFPLVEGEPGEFGATLTRDERADVLALLASLHQTAVPDRAPVASPELAGWSIVEEALRGDGWPGPYGEPARALLADHRDVLRGRRAEFDQGVAALSTRVVLTHGEPHPGNFLRHGSRLRLVDWDTVGTAVPERDLWLVVAESADLDRYADATGHEPDQAALDLYRLRWALDDVTAYLRQFRAPHGDTADARESWGFFVATLANLGRNTSSRTLTGVVDPPMIKVNPTERTPPNWNRL
ncbi:phosphotransferase enzyme family protein [Actinokineospora sp. HUAS TT18]|uniref:phosphotransferase enzyme family protein n=1 Tax=Actinokineospora sp. HUAS TT18 TaxID=3447451 RepID=UPI003F52723A